MSKKDDVLNNILIAMQPHLGSMTLQILEKAIRAELYNVDLVEVETMPSTQFDDNEYIIKLFIARKATKLSKKTAKYYLHTLKNFLSVVDKSLMQITSNDIEYYLSQYESAGNQATTVNNARRNLSAFFSWMRKFGLITVNPVENTDKRKETIKPIDNLESEEIERLRESCVTDRERALMEYMRSTGCRLGEIPAVRVRDINWNNGEIVIYAPKQKKYRSIYLDDVARFYMRKYLMSRPDIGDKLFAGMGLNGKSNLDVPVFSWIRDPGKNVHEAALRDEIYKIKRRSELDRRVYPHLFRKTLGMKLRRNRCPEDLIMNILGDDSADVVRKHYSANTPAQIYEAHRLYAGG